MLNILLKKKALYKKHTCPCIVCIRFFAALLFLNWLQRFSSIKYLMLKVTGFLFFKAKNFSAFLSVLPERPNFLAVLKDLLLFK